MKKTIVIIVAALGFALAASAQPKAIGGRLGYGLEASYQHFIGGPNFLEVNLGLDRWSSVDFSAAATYNFVFAQPSWTPRGYWAWYAGPGVTFGFDSDIDNESSKTYSYFGIVGQIGLEYEFWFPLQLSVDLRPTFGYCNGGFYGRGFENGLIPTLSIRYRF